MKFQFVLLTILALTAAAMLSSEGRAIAGGQIDLSGDWTVAVEGDVTLTCTAGVQQTGNDLTAQLNCPGTMETPLYGSFDSATRQVDLDLSGEQGLDVELHGTASEDGNEVDGEWNWSYELFGTFHAVRGAAPAPIPDLTGRWTFDTGDDALGSCAGEVHQNGATVKLDLECPGELPVSLTGQLDGQVLTLGSGSSYAVRTVVSSDGLALGGGWYNGPPARAAGPFTGLKNIARTFAGDVTGDWQITITAGLFGVCDVGVEQSDGAIFAAFDCGIAGAWWLRGTIDSATGTFRLEGTAGSEGDYHAVIRGVMGEDGQSFTGAFAATYSDESSSFGGTLAGEQMDDSPSFMDVNGQYDLRLASQLGETVPCQLDVEQQQEALSASAGCSGVGVGQLDGSINPLTGTFSIEGRIGAVGITFDGTANDRGSRIDLSGAWITPRRFVQGCFQTQVPVICNQGLRNVPGDFNCNSRTDSIDAALVLQYSARLGPDLKTFCSSNVYDLQLRCCPVLIDATDAAIILQLNAGLLGRLAG